MSSWGAQGHPGDVVLDLLPEPSAVPAVRRALRSMLRETGQEQWAEAAELACTELVTNAVLHAHTPFTVTVEALEDGLRVGVSDGSPELPRQRSGDTGATTGRGLLLVAQLASEHGVRIDPAGKTVWFTLSGRREGVAHEPTADELLAMWDDEPGDVPRRAHDHETDASQIPTPTPVRVRLTDMPASLWLASAEHHRTLLREMVLYEAAPADAPLHDGSVDQPDPGTTAGDLEAAAAAHTLLAGAVAAAVDDARAKGTARRPLPDTHPADLPWVPGTVDLVLDVPQDAIGRFAALQDVLDLAERLAATDRLLARPGLPEVVAVRDWACEQVLAQAAGAPAAPWPGTDHERFVAAQDDLSDAAGWDVTAVRASPGAVVAADDSNRIIWVSPTMAELVGWDAGDLVGRRVVTLIPPGLREAHVAGFSRHLVTGQARLLGIPVELPVLRSDGTTVRCTVTIEQAASQGSRRLYLARFQAPDPDV